MSVTFYDNFEDMMEALDEAREAADANVKDWQKELKKGDCFLQFTDYGFDIYGEVLEEYDKETDPHMEHYRFCKCYSPAVPYGELGDVHVSVIAGKISEQAFEGIVGRLQGKK